MVILFLQIGRHDNVVFLLPVIISKQNKENRGENRAGRHFRDPMSVHHNFLNGPTPYSVSFILVFLNTQYNFYNK